MNCKFCGAEVNKPESSPVVTEFYCGSMVAASGEWSQSNYCELQKYKEMFPVAPWDDGPITPEVCERLGLVSLDNEKNIFRLADSPASISVWMWSDGPEVTFHGAGDTQLTTAGQLACLVAARSKKQCSNP